VRRLVAAFKSADKSAHSKKCPSDLITAHQQLLEVVPLTEPGRLRSLRRSEQLSFFKPRRYGTPEPRGWRGSNSSKDHRSTSVLLLVFRDSGMLKRLRSLPFAALADYRRTRTKEAEIEVRELLDDLMAMSLKGFRGALGDTILTGNRGPFFAPRGTPTVVPTAFAVRALCEAVAVLDRDAYLRVRAHGLRFHY
jgi:hypothetical protein